MLDRIEEGLELIEELRYLLMTMSTFVDVIVNEFLRDPKDK